MKNALSKYEQREIVAIEEWKNAKPPVASQVVGIAVKPLVWAAQKVMPTKAIEGCLKATDAAARWLTDTGDILRDGHVQSISELKHKDLQLSDELSNVVHNWALGIAATEGVVTGVVGLPGLVADIPILITLSLRTIHKIGLCYGYEAETELDRQFALGILAAAGSSCVKEKVLAVQFLRKVQEMLAKVAWKMIAEKAAAGKSLEAAVIMAIKELAKQLGVNITKRGALKIIPFVGGVVGGTVNAAFLQDICWAARRMYQERWLIENGKVTIAV